MLSVLLELHLWVAGREQDEPPHELLGAGDAGSVEGRGDHDQIARDPRDLAEEHLALLLRDVFESVGADDCVEATVSEGQPAAVTHDPPHAGKVVGRENQVEPDRPQIGIEDREVPGRVTDVENVDLPRAER